jgi:hypothetical protein
MLEDVQGALIVLVDQSLLEQHPCTAEDAQFQMLGIVRAYAWERLQRWKDLPSAHSAG